MTIKIRVEEVRELQKHLEALTDSMTQLAMAFEFSINQLLKDRCRCCGRVGAIKWNPDNEVTQCHHCGTVVDEPHNDKEKVIFT